MPKFSNIVSCRGASWYPDTNSKLHANGWDSASRPRQREFASVSLTLFLQLRDARGAVAGVVEI